MIHTSHIRLLALDIGTRRTGIAYCDDTTDVVLPLTTIEHHNAEELLNTILEVLSKRSIDLVVIGLPLLPSGEEGQQVNTVRAIGEQLKERIPVVYIDERYTTRGNAVDPDAEAACVILTTFLERRKSTHSVNTEDI